MSISLHCEWELPNLRSPHQRKHVNGIWLGQNWSYVFQNRWLTRRQVNHVNIMCNLFYVFFARNVNEIRYIILEHWFINSELSFRDHSPIGLENGHFRHLRLDGNTIFEHAHSSFLFVGFGPMMYTPNESLVFGCLQHADRWFRELKIEVNKYRAINSSEKSNSEFQFIISASSY